MTSEEFKEKVKELWLEVDDTDAEFLLSIVIINEDNTVEDCDVITSSCMCCHSDLLVAVIKKENIKHLGNNHKIH